KFVTSQHSTILKNKPIRLLFVES
ncbi:uncharacterized protein METZ01_LOCUS399965, partial [marine metagenome]